MLGSVVAALAAVGGVFALTGALEGRGSGADIRQAVESGEEPESVADSFLAAVRSGDCNRAYNFVKQPEQFPGQMDEQLFKQHVCGQAPTGDVDTTVVQRLEETATVEAKGQETSVTYEVEKVDGRWKIDPLAPADSEK